MRRNSTGRATDAVRYRAILFGRPAGPWRASMALAQDDAVNSDLATRDPFSGAVYLAAGVTVAKAEGEVETSIEQELWSDALTLVRRDGGRAAKLLHDEIGAPDDDSPDRLRKKRVKVRVEEVLREARREHARAW